MSQHTPGPWTCEPIKALGVYVVTPYPRGSTWGEVASQDEANARLIAKAPEMVALLKDLCAAYPDASDHDAPWTEVRNLIDQIEKGA